MTIYEAYDKRRGALLGRLEGAKTLAQAQSFIGETCDAVLYDYANDCADDELRALAADMLNAVKSSLPLLECASRTRVWSAQVGSDSEEKPVRWPAILALALGAALIAGAIFVYISQSVELRASDWEGYAAAIGCGALLMLAAGLLFGRRPKIVAKAQTELRADVSIDPEDAVRRLNAVMLQCDKSLAAREALDAARLAENRKRGLASDELELICSLLEGGCSEDGETALEQLSQLRHYLIRHGFELRDYAEGQDMYFQLLPGGETRTLRPAIFSDGELVKKGLATCMEGN